LETESFNLILLAFLLFVSALFSGSEVALFSLDKKRLEKSDEKDKLINRYLLSLLANPHRLLVTILLGNTLVNVAASIVAVTFALNLSEKFGIAVELALTAQIVILTLLIILLAEITPKVWASKHPYKFSRIIAIPLYWTAVVIYPVSKVLTEFFSFVMRKIKIDKRKSVIKSEEIKHLATLSAERGAIEEGEQELIHGIVTFGSVTVKEIMTPRVDIKAVPIDAKYADVIKIVNDSGRSRLPLFREDLDHIEGIVYAKDLLRFLKHPNPDEALNIRKIARTAYFVPENKLINELLREFQEKNIHLGIVVDEYGGTSGLVSLEDILEEIVGEIRDEFDKDEVEFQKISDDKYLALGKYSISDLSEELGVDFGSENEDYETLGGFIFNYAGEIPEKGFSFVEKGYRFTVKSLKNRRIEKVLIEKVG
jgi:gliding motility-associated protein GldE